MADERGRRERRGHSLLVRNLPMSAR